MFQVLEIQASDEESSPATFTFTSPPNFGTFELRAYAVSADGAHFATASTEIIVRRPISLTPAVPRVVRVGDTFACGVIVTLARTVSPSNPVNVTVKIEVSASVALANGAQSVN